MSLPSRFTQSSAALARLRAVKVERTVQIEEPEREPMQPPPRPHTRYWCMHQTEGATQKCEHGCNSFGGYR